MGEILFNEIVTEAYNKEFMEFASVPKHHFSRKHNKKMKLLFSERTSSGQRSRSQIKLKYIWLVIILSCLIALTGFVIMFFVDGFKGTVYHDNTHLFAINTEGCPTTIEKEYELSVLPGGYTLSKSTNGSFYSKKVYRNKDNQDLTFIQYVKSKFNLHINTEGYEPVETVINGHNAIYIDFDNQEVTIVWDSNDYILEISGIFNKDELLKLAELNETRGFE